MALLSLPRFCSHSPSNSYRRLEVKNNEISNVMRITLMTVTRKRFSSSSTIAPEIEPIAQQS